MLVCGVILIYMSVHSTGSKHHLFHKPTSAQNMSGIWTITYMHKILTVIFFFLN